MHGLRLVIGYLTFTFLVCLAGYELNPYDFDASLSAQSNGSVPELVISSLSMAVPRSEAIVTESPLPLVVIVIPSPLIKVRVSVAVSATTLGCPDTVIVLNIFFYFLA